MMTAMPSNTIPERFAALLKRPQYVLVQITSRCNAKCSFCCNGNMQKPFSNEITPEQAGKIAAGLRYVFHLAISGGEPFLRDDMIPWIDAFCRNARVMSVTLATNGSRPDRIAQTLEILSSRHAGTTFSLVLSVDAHGHRHDAIRSFPGLYQRIKESYHAALNVRRAHPKTLRLILSSVLSTENEDFFLQDMDLLRRDFPDADSHEVNLVRPNRDNPGRKDVAVDTCRKVLAQVTKNRSGGTFYHNIHQALFERANDLALRAAMGRIPHLACLAGQGFVTINPSGQVILCEERSDIILDDLSNYQWNLRALLDDPKISRQASLLRRNCFCRSDCIIRFNLTHSFSQYPAIALALAGILRKKRHGSR